MFMYVHIMQVSLQEVYTNLLLLASLQIIVEKLKFHEKLKYKIQECIKFYIIVHKLAFFEMQINNFIYNCVT